MFGSTISSAERPTGALRLALLRAADLTIAVLTLESYSLTDVAPGAAAAVEAADAHRAAPVEPERRGNSRDCSTRECEPQLSRAYSRASTRSAGRRLAGACTAAASPRAVGFPASPLPRRVR